MEAQSFYPRVRQYYRRFVPLFEKPKVVAYTMFTLSFLTVSIFGIFAIRPTLATIVQLKRRIEDQQLVNARTQEKIAALRVAEVEYESLRRDFEAIFEAMPAKPESASLLGKLNRSLVENNVDLVILQLSTIPAEAPKPPPPQAEALSFTLTARGSYEAILKLIDFLSRADRIMTLDIVDISAPRRASQTSESGLTVVVRGKAYVLWEGLPAGEAGKGEKGG